MLGNDLSIKKNVCQVAAPVAAVVVVAGFVAPVLEQSAVRA